MNLIDIPRHRLHNQGLARPAFRTAAGVVEALGAVQAQDYAGAKWALGLRMPGATDADIEQAFTHGEILRTHLMRPTWHFVAAADIRWMLELTGPRVHAGNAYRYRQLELDETQLKLSRSLLEKGLLGGRQLTRNELRLILEQGGIPALEGQRLAYIVMQAELEGLICSGPRRGKQFTYMLLDERVPQGKTLERDEALAELVRRYFTTHGPALIKDFTWWSGLTASDARRGLEMVHAHLEQERIDRQTYWFPNTGLPAGEQEQAAYLLPNYDEYTVSYRDHSAVFDPAFLDRLVFSHVLVLDGRVAGTWKRSLQKRAVQVEIEPFEALSAAGQRAVESAAHRYGVYLELPVELGMM